MQRRFRHYDVINVIDQQDTSSTYLVSTSSKLGHRFTLKVFHKPALLSLATQEKFSQDLKKFGRLRHPHIVPVIEGGIEQGSGYIVSDYTYGDSLRVRLNEASPEPLPFSEAMTIITQLGQALSYLHSQQIVHGHLRPEHVFFDAQDQILLADIYSPERTLLYDKDALIDVYRYLSPEQCQDTSGQQHGSAFSDQYALCCVAYEVLTGRTPFVETNIMTLKERQMHAEPASLTSLVPDLPAEVNDAVLKGLAKDPAQRHADVASFLTTLQPAPAALLDPNLDITQDLDITQKNALSLPPADATIGDMPEDEKVWTKLISESETTPMMIESLRTPILKTSEESTDIIDPQVIAQQAPRPKKRARPLPWIAATIVAIIIISVIAYMLFSADTNVSVARVASTHATTSTATTGKGNAQNTPSKTLKPDPDAVATVTPTPISTATATTPNNKPTATSVSATPTPSLTPTPNPLLFTGQLSTQAKKVGASATALIPALTVSNVRIEADVTNSTNSGGVIFRGGYNFRIGTDGSYILETSNNTLVNKHSSAIKTGDNASNHVTIVAQGSSIAITINSQSLINLTDSSYSSGGVGVIAVEFLTATTTTCNFSIYTV